MLCRALTDAIKNTISAGRGFTASPAGKGRKMGKMESKKQWNFLLKNFMRRELSFDCPVSKSVAITAAKRISGKDFFRILED